MSRTVALLTDFGAIDPYVGIMKGVLLSRCPEVLIVDVTHGVSPQDVRQGALHLMSAVAFFPVDTIFVCVVDPGVGSRRAVIYARTDTHEFLAPDNGLLSWVSRVETIREVRSPPSPARGLAVKSPLVCADRTHS